MSFDRSISNDQDELQSSNDQDPRAPVKHRSRPTSSNQAPVKTHKLWSSTGQYPWAPIKHWWRPTSFDLSLYWFVRMGLFVCGCGCVCLCASEEKEDEERKTEFVGCARRKERKKKVRTKINKITNAQLCTSWCGCFFLLKLCKSS